MRRLLKSTSGCSAGFSEVYCPSDIGEALPPSAVSEAASTGSFDLAASMIAVPGEAEVSNKDPDDDAERQWVMDGLCASTRPHQEAQGYTDYASPGAKNALNTKVRHTEAGLAACQAAQQLEQVHWQNVEEAYSTAPSQLPRDFQFALSQPIALSQPTLVRHTEAGLAACQAAQQQQQQQQQMHRQKLDEAYPTAPSQLPHQSTLHQLDTTSSIYLAPKTSPKMPGFIPCEVRVYSNLAPRQCRRAGSCCKICGGQAMVLVRDLPFTIDGHLLDAHLLVKGMLVHIDLVYCVRHESSGSSDLHMVKKICSVTLNSRTGPFFRMLLPAGQLEPSRNAVCQTKKRTSWRHGEFHPCIVAEVKYVSGDGCLSIPTIYQSKALYVCSSRQIRKVCNTGPYSAPAPQVVPAKSERPPKRMALPFLMDTEGHVDPNFATAASCDTPLLDLNAPPSDT